MPTALENDLANFVADKAPSGELIELESVPRDEAEQGSSTHDRRPAFTEDRTPVKIDNERVPLGLRRLADLRAQPRNRLLVAAGERELGRVFGGERSCRPQTVVLARSPLDLA